MFQVHDGKLGTFDTVVLEDARSQSRVTIAPARGALVTSLFAHGREWLYLDEATFLDPGQNVRGGIPVLFPSPGKLERDRFVFGGKSGAMKQHGFARTTTFHEAERGTDGSAWLELELADSERTRAVFPWSFRLRLRFMLRGATLTLHAQIDNTGAEPLPFALGYHPYFAVPSADKGQCRIPTQATRAWDNVRKREIVLEPIDLASGEVDLHLVDHGSNGATLETPAGTVELGGHFARWVIWTLPSRDFVCLEPWSAPAGALSSGQGLITLPPGAERRLSLDIAVRRRSRFGGCDGASGG